MLLELRVWKTIPWVLSGRLRITSFNIVQGNKANTIDGASIYIVINTLNPSNSVTSVKRPLVVKCNLFLVLSLTISYELNLFYPTFSFMSDVLYIVVCSFEHFVVYPSSISGFWLPLWYFQGILKGLFFSLFQSCPLNAGLTVSSAK